MVCYSDNPKSVSSNPTRAHSVSSDTFPTDITESTHFAFTWYDLGQTFLKYVTTITKFCTDVDRIFFQNVFSGYSGTGEVCRFLVYLYLKDKWQYLAQLKYRTILLSHKQLFYRKTAKAIIQPVRLKG